MLIKLPMDLLQIGEQGIFFEFKINTAFGKPGVG
jgi:hypothetical protein